MKLVNSLEDFGLLIKHISLTRKKKMKQRNKKRISWDVIRKFRSLFIRKSFNSQRSDSNESRTSAIRASKETIRAGENVLISPHPLTNFEIQKFYQN